VPTFGTNTTNTAPTTTPNKKSNVNPNMLVSLFLNTPELRGAKCIYTAQTTIKYTVLDSGTAWGCLWTIL